MSVAVVDPAPFGRRIRVRGSVQGVGFRPWVARLARESGLGGSIANAGEGVIIEAFGTRPALDGLLERLAHPVPPAADVQGLDWEEIPAQDAAGFTIAPGADDGRGAAMSMPPDLATCPRCAAEIADAANRRFHYAFTSCTDCGPRFSIALARPYRRANTTMAPFAPCPRCRHEAENPRDHRFHDAPIACPECGPRLRLIDAEGRALVSERPLRAAARAIEAGLIVAVKGLGGFELVCDATSGLAVGRLRQRKRSAGAPFAVLVKDLERAWMVADLVPGEEDLLLAVERPVVVARRRPSAGLAVEVALGSPWLGVALPYSPLHQLLSEEVNRPLAITSGNVSGQPVVRGNDEAREQLREVADLFLVDDREIAARCETTVVKWVAGGPVLLRRSRGYVPRAVRLARAVERPVLACGGGRESVFCIAIDDQAFLGPHVGALDGGRDTSRATAASGEAFGEAVEHLERFLGVEPRVVAHDARAGLVTTAYAETRPGQRVAVPHARAHAASALAEQGLVTPAFGLVWDGDDGEATGGELLLAYSDAAEVIATFRPLPLAAAEHEPWQLALAALDDAFFGEPPLERLAAFDGRDVAARRAVRLETEISPRILSTSAAGRLFDVLSTLLLAGPQRGHGRPASLSLEGLTRELPRARGEGGYAVCVDRSTAVWQYDWRPLLRGAVDDLLRGVPASTIAARAHTTLAAAAAELLAAAREVHGDLPVVLAGDCFANARLVEGLLSATTGLDIRVPRVVPPGDGGLALGQVLVADAQLRLARAAAIAPALYEGGV